MKATTDILVMMAKIASPKSINVSHNTYKESKEKRNLKRAISTVTKKIKKRVEPSQKQKRKLKQLRQRLKIISNEEKLKDANQFNDNLTKILKNNPKKFYKKISSMFYTPQNTGLPKKLVYKDKTYLGKEVLEGFRTLAKDKSLDPKRQVGAKPLDYYNIMRDVVNAKKLELQQDTSEVKKLNLKEYKKLIKKYSEIKPKT